MSRIIIQKWFVGAYIEKYERESNGDDDVMGRGRAQTWTDEVEVRKAVLQGEGNFSDKNFHDFIKTPEGIKDAMVEVESLIERCKAYNYYNEEGEPPFPPFKQFTRKSALEAIIKVGEPDPTWHIDLLDGEFADMAKELPLGETHHYIVVKRNDRIEVYEATQLGAFQKNSWEENSYDFNWPNKPVMIFVE